MATKRLQLSFDGEAAGEELYTDLLSLRIEETTRGSSTLSLRLAVTLDANGGWSHVDDDRLTPFGGISAGVGVAGEDLQPVFDGYVTALELGLGGEPGTTTLDVVAMDAGALMGLEEKVATWDNLSDDQIVGQIVQDYGISVDAQSTATVHRENVTTVVQRASDLAFVRALARRNGFEFFLVAGETAGAATARFREPDLQGRRQADLAVQFGDASNLTSFRARLDGRRPLTVQGRQLAVRTVDATRTSASSTSLKLLGAHDLAAVAGDRLDALVTPADAQSEMLVLAGPTDDGTELQTAVQAIRDEAGWFISASGEVNTEAYGGVLRAGRPVLVKGAGDAYSGTYYVVEVVHELTASGSYAQRFEARRNARDLDGSERFGNAGAEFALMGV